MFKPTYRDIRIRGIVYPTIAEAATSLGVSSGAVLKAFHAGRLDGVGLGPRGRELMPIRIRGKTYANAQLAADRFGMTRAAIYSALHRGDLDRIGMPPRVGRAKSVPFELGGMHWPSMRQASMDLGFHPEYVSRSFLKRRKSAQQRILGAAMALAAKRCPVGSRCAS